jgi:hypothetical protein
VILKNILNVPMTVHNAPINQHKVRAFAEMLPHMIEPPLKGSLGRMLVEITSHLEMLAYFSNRKYVTSVLKIL